MKKKLPLLSAIALLSLWVAMLIAVPAVLNLFTGFKVEMPALTMALIQAVHFMGGAALPLVVLASAFLLGSRQLVGWIFALALCLAWDFAFLGLLMPCISLMNNLSAGPTPVATPSLSVIQSVLIFLVFSLNQALFIFLLAKRQEWLAPAAPQSLAPYAPISNP